MWWGKHFAAFLHETLLRCLGERTLDVSRTKDTLMTHNPVIIVIKYILKEATSALCRESRDGWISIDGTINFMTMKKEGNFFLITVASRQCSMGCILEGRGCAEEGKPWVISVGCAICGCCGYIWGYCVDVIDSVVVEVGRKMSMFGVVELVELELFS